LAGIYDTEGTIANCANVIRIYNSNPDVITQTTSALKLINIPYVIEKCKSIVNKQVYSIRILSDSTLKNLSFILSINPAIKRKGIDNFLDRSLLKRQNILSIDRIDGPVKVFSFETESHTYIADTIAVHNCVEDKDLPNEKMWTIPILEDLCQWIRRQSPKNKVNLSFFGGEPLLEWESIKEFMTYGLKHHSDIIDFNISTNIVLLDREKLDWLDKNTEPGQITFLLSLDGFERVKSRHAAGNKNNNLMHIIRKNLAVMRDDYNRLFKNSSFRVSVMPEYLDILEEDLFEMVDYGPENIIIHPVTTEPSAPWTEDKYVMLTDLINKVCRYAIETSSVEIECMEGVSKKDHNCGAGHSMLAMNADGKIYSCYFTAHAELDFDVIGDFRSDEVNEIRANIYQLNPNYDPKCISCDKKYCFQCSVKNLLHHGQHFCSSMWCKELADLYSDTLDLCLKTRINSRISKNAKHGLDISHVNEEMECMINDMAGLINSLLSNAPYQPKGDDCGCHSATSSKLDLLQNIMDLSSIKLGLEAIHNQRFPGNAVSSV
jgi:radical SAM protein with 4Fe4S-binding SPASM domain